MRQTLLTGRWLRALALATAFFVVCLGLGAWQWGRHEERSAAAEAVQRHYDAAPVPLDRALPAGTALREDEVWTTVTATGEYADAPPLMVRNRPQDVTYGYEVLTPLRLPDGTALLVDRGWVRNGPNADTLPAVPPTPRGRVTVTGWLRQGEPSLDRTLRGGQLASINLEEAERQSGLRLRGAYLVLRAEDDGTGRQPPRPAALLAPDTGTGPHLGYAIQWWCASLVGFVLVGVYLRRELREASSDQAAARPARPAKRRIWDEEDE